MAAQIRQAARNAAGGQAGPGVRGSTHVWRDFSPVNHGESAVLSGQRDFRTWEGEPLPPALYTGPCPYPAAMTNAPAVLDDAMQDRQRCTEHCKQHLNILDLMEKQRNEGASKDCALMFATFMDESTIRENADVDRAEFPSNSYPK